MDALDETRNRIREQAKQLYFKYGIRSVSMDDIAVGLGMSKKTIYQYFADKDELVEAIIEDDIRDTRTDCEICFTQSSDALEEIFLTLDRMLEHLGQMNPTILYDLHKFHFNSFKKFQEHKNSYLLEIIRKNLERGISEGLYRHDINVDILSRFRLESMMLVFNMEIFPQTKYSIVEVTMTIIENFMFGVVTPKGYDLIIKYKQERQNKMKYENR
ncbi:MAG TPA: TetR/AcrR family transcriptional regulator [Chitinophagaceae bacterium]|nr:TetR/AcrR family transcriptional regulator [Chitinophagaceae bacterium]